MASVAQPMQFRQALIPQASAPIVPTVLDDLHVPSAVLENLLLKQLSAYPKSDVLQLTRLMAIGSHMVEDLLAILRKKSLVEVFRAEGTYSQPTNAAGHIRYGLSEAGMAQADIAFKRDAYLGPAPVSLEDYHHMVEAQDVRAHLVTRPDVTLALSDVYGAERMISVLGPAINSGRALLLYGDAGTGKTYVATRLLNALNTSVYIPYAVYAAGNIIKVFSKQHHKAVSDGSDSQGLTYKEQYDKRWVLSERPSIQVGGELTMDMLEVNHTEHNRVWMAPLQMMANNGIFIIDDLGRQPMPVDAILNRWIVPMEYFYDYLSLPNGQQISVPFVLTLAFSTNLDPEKISDPAFLRRLGYKIQFHPLERHEYHALWEEMAMSRHLSIHSASFDTLYDLHQQHDVGFYPCLPKDLIGISRDIIAFENIEPLVTSEILMRAWEVYFTADGNGGGAR
ncbi:AAA family ATPase [Vibrio fluvialis]|nr:AAA family ATPase [Vibrio fluvialis]